jgi:short subunit dehydrogenase-like uncharacterized protein
MSAAKEIWILGAAGRTGRAIAANLVAQQVPVVAVGRDRERLNALVAQLGPLARAVVAGSLDATLAALREAGAAVVVNTIGPFADTAVPVIRACGPGGHYVDLSNELSSTLAVLALHDEAVAAGRTLVACAGWGVLGTESVTLKLCEGRPPAQRVRVDMIPTVEGEGPLGEALAASLVDGLAAGGRRYERGALTRAGLGSEPLRLALPDGTTAMTGSTPSGELEAAHRASGAPFVTAASSMAPTGAVARAGVAVIGALVQWRWLREVMKRRLARVEASAPKQRREHSWAHARVEWADGTVREGWLKAPEGMTFTTRVAAEVAARLATGRGRPGAYTPGALFGAELAVAAGGELSESRVSGTEPQPSSERPAARGTFTDPV